MMTSTVRPLGFALLMACVCLTACQVRERSTGGRVTVRPATPETTLIALADVFTVDEVGDETRVGILRTYEFDDDEAHKVTRVFDQRDRPIGYITSDGKAYRVKAHGGEDLVAVGARLEANVASVLGKAGTSVRIRPVTLRDQ